MMKLNTKLRRFIRKTIRNLGFQRRIAPDFVDVMSANDIDVVLDVGANDGDYGREIRDRGYTGLIVSFEPNPVVFERLKSLIAKDNKWEAYPFALGEIDGDLKLSIATNDTMSSLKGLTLFGQGTGAKYIGQTRCKVMRLDTFLNERPELIKNVYLKIDTQGYEMEVLRGTGNMLAKMAVVQAEVALVHTYTDESDWLTFIQWMRIQKFEIATAVCNSAIGAQVREFDFVFVRRDKELDLQK